jgi:diguanylate cyclase (GGDEF)-like protein
LQEDVNNNTYYDPLTGLPNRTLFHDRLIQSLALAGRNQYIMAVLFVSIDNLKLINDTMGQPCGDQILKTVIERIKGCLRRSDTLARPGGAEFMILLPEIAQSDDAEVLVKRIFHSLDSPFRCEKHELFVNPTVGISIFPDDGDDPAVLIKNAYTAMQRARELEKGTHKFYSKTMNDKAFERMLMENSLRLALKRKEFILHFQPQVDLSTGLISGMETLVRWQRPETGLVYPNSFIRIMEKANLIASLSEWILYEACRQNKAWQEAGFRPVRIAVNLSASFFLRQDMVEMISRVLEETGLNPEYLELEITESIFMRNLENTVKTLKGLRDKGVCISIDDFGTGYSSLSYLKYLPINRLKIVGSFISSLSVDPADTVIAKVIIAMAHALNMRVIAEGVEKEEQLELMRSLQCDELQGNIISLPVPMEEVSKIMADEHYS